MIEIKPFYRIISVIGCILFGVWSALFLQDMFNSGLTLKEYKLFIPVIFWAIFF